MKKRSSSFVVPLHIYPFSVVFSLGQTDDDLSRTLRKLKFDPLNYFDHDISPGRCTMFPDGDQILRLADFPVDAEHYGYLQHEIFHCVENVMEKVGIKLDGSSSEAFAYLVSYLTENVYNRLWNE